MLTSVGESTIANPPPNVVSRVPFTSGVPSTTAEMFITTSLYLLSRGFCICIPSFWTHDRTFSGLFGKKTQWNMLSPGSRQAFASLRKTIVLYHEAYEKAIYYYTADFALLFQV